MGKHKPELTNDEFIAALNAECRKRQRCGVCDNACLYIGWCEDVYTAFWERRNNEPVTLVSGGCNG